MSVSDQELYDLLLKRKSHTKLHCDLCGERFSFDSMNMCKRCASVVCFRCVWATESSRTKRNCQCGGEFD